MARKLPTQCDTFPIRRLKVKNPFSWQKKAISKGEKSDFFLCQAPCGSGKSIVQRELAVRDIVKNGRKQLVLVPQTAIASAFIRPAKHGNISLQINEHNAFTKESDRGRRLREFLLGSVDSVVLYDSSQKTIQAGFAVATMAAFSAVWKSLKSEKEKKKALSNLVLRVDEAHHIGGASDQDEHENINILGAAVSHILKNRSYNNCGIHMTTATPFRGDFGHVIHRDVFNELFERYTLDRITQLQNAGIEQVIEMYSDYDTSHDMFESIVFAIKKNDRPWLIIVPASTHGWRESFLAYKPLIKRLKEAFPKKNIVDSIPKENHEGVRQLLANQGDPKKHVDILVTCNLVREGVDWPACGGVIFTEPGNSPVVEQQVRGRAERKYKGKKDVRFLTFMPAWPENGNPEKQRLAVSHRINSLLVYLHNIEDLIFGAVPLGKVKVRRTQKVLNLVHKLFDEAARGLLTREALTEVASLESVYGSVRAWTEEVHKEFERSLEGIVLSQLPKKIKLSNKQLNDVALWIKSRLVHSMLRNKIRDATKQPRNLVGDSIEWIAEHGFDKAVRKTDGSVVAAIGLHDHIKFLEIVHSGRVFFTKQQEEEICRKYRNGESVRQLGRIFNRDPRTISRVIKRHGVDIRYNSKGIPQNREQEVCIRYIKGESVKDISEGFRSEGVTVDTSTVYRILKRNEIKRRTKGIPQNREQEVCIRYIKGESAQDISEGFRSEGFTVDTSTVYNVLKRNEIKRRTISEAKGGLPKKHEKEVCRLYLNGMTIKHIAKDLEVTKNTIRNTLIRHKIKRRSSAQERGFSKLTSYKERRICILYQKGKNTIQLAKDFEVDPTTIIRILKRHNIKIRSSSEALSNLSENQKIEVRNLYAKGNITMMLLAQKFGVSKSVIQRCAK